VTHLATSRWRYKHVYVWSYVCVLGEAQVQPMKFGVDWIKGVGVISFFVLHGE